MGCYSSPTTRMAVHAYTLRVNRRESYSQKNVVRVFGMLTCVRTQMCHDMYMDVHREYTRAILAANIVHVIFMDATSKKIVLPSLGGHDYLMNGVLCTSTEERTVYSFGGLICGMEPAMPMNHRGSLSVLLSTVDRAPLLCGCAKGLRRRSQSSKERAQATAATAAT